MHYFNEQKPNPEKIGAYYDNIEVGTYDDFVKMIQYTSHDPEFVAKLISKPQPEQETDPTTGEVNYGYLNMPRDAAIFDMGHGTGLLGKLMNAHGYTNIDGGDASQSFVDSVKKTGWYNNSSVLWFGGGVENLPKHLLGKYDVVMAAGVFYVGHIPATGFDDAHALCKPGGHFVTAIRGYYMEPGGEHGYREKLDELEAAGKIKILKSWEFKRGLKDSEDPKFGEMNHFLFIAKRMD